MKTKAIPLGLAALSGLLITLGCASGPASTEPASPAEVAPTPEPASVESADPPPTEPSAVDDGAEGPCEVVCEQVVVDRSAEEPDHDWQATTDDANRVLGAMRDDFMACYEERLVAKPSAHAFMTLSVVVGPKGNVQNVDTTGGALLGEKGRQCIADTVRKGQFAPPHRGGTLRIEVPFTLRRVADDEDE